MAFNLNKANESLLGQTQTGNKSRAQDARGPSTIAEALTDEVIQSNVSALITDAVRFMDDEISPTRATNTNFYLGKPFGNEEDGRSQVVLTDVRDSVLGIMPQMLRVFTSAERAVEFEPKREELVEQAEQATDYVNYVFLDQNDGFSRMHSVLKDGLVRRVGIFKWGWDDRVITRSYILDNLNEEQVEKIEEDEDVTIVKKTSKGQVTGPHSPIVRPNPRAQGIEPQPEDVLTDKVQGIQQEELFTLEVLKTNIDGRVWIDSLPPEEFLFSREGRTIEEATLIAHRTNKERGELIAMGFDPEIVDQHAADDTTLRNNLEVIARRQVIEAGSTQDVPTGPENDKILYVEAYVKMDCDGDGIPELRRVCTLGLNYFIISNERAEERPFAIFCPDPEPHTMLGQSFADLSMDLQMINSMIMRGMLDSLSASIFPRMGIVEGQVNISDAMNTEIGALIRIKNPNAIQSFAHPFVGKEALPILQFLQEIKEGRTGQNKGAMGLDADALQSTSANAAEATIQAAQLRVEMLCKIFAETTLKPLFKGILRLLVTHQPKQQVVRLRGKWVNVQPDAWDADMDVRVNVGLGVGDTARKMAILSQAYSEQKDILAALGPSNPVVKLWQFSHTASKMLETAGIRDTENYFTKVDRNWQPPPPPPPSPSPEMVQVQGQLEIEKMKSQRDLSIKEAELQLKRQQADFDQKFQIQKQADSFALQLMQIDAQFKAQFREQDLETMGDQIDRQLSGVDMAHKHAIDRVTAAHQMMLDAQAQQHSQGLAEDQQDFDQSQAAQEPADAGGE